VSEEYLKAQRMAERPTLLGLAAWAYISPCGLAKPVMAKERPHGPQEAPKAPKGPLEDPSMEAHEGDVLGEPWGVLGFPLGPVAKGGCPKCPLPRSASPWPPYIKSENPPLSLLRNPNSLTLCLDVVN
jgi:hypothetical protein